MAEKSTSAIIAKARSLYGKRPSSEDYKSLINKQDVTDVVLALKNMPSYKISFSALNETVVHRGQAEELMKKSVFEVYARLCKFQFKTRTGFESYLVKREEIKQIVNALMYINSNVVDALITSFPAFLMDYTSFDLIKLSKATDFNQLLEVLKDTWYYNVLAPLLKGREQFDIANTEHELYKAYYDWILSQIKQEYSGKERTELEHCVLRNIDFYNLTMCFRLKGLFKQENSLVKESIIPLHYRIAFNTLEEIIEKGNTEDIMPLILKLPYFKNIEDNEVDLETAIRKVNYDYFRRKMKLSTYPSVVMYSLIELLEIENRNLTSLIEGIRYSLDAAEIQKMLVI